MHNLTTNNGDWSRIEANELAEVDKFDVKALSAGPKS